MSITNQANSREKWRTLIEEQESSGLSQREFCKQKEVALSQFGYYRSIFKARCKPEKEKGNFVPVMINQSAFSNHGIHLKLPNNIECQIPIGTHNKLVRELIEILLSC